MGPSLDRTRPLLCFVHDARMAAEPLDLWAVTDNAWSRVDLVQVRGKALPAADLERLVRGWVGRLSGLATRVIVNDRLDVALATSADGAHLGQDDLPLETARRLTPPGFLLGASVHDRDELLRAQAAGADYAGLGALFPSGTKPVARPLDPHRAGLTDALEGLEAPVLAIGGITAGRVAAAFRLRAVSGVAVSGAIQKADDPGWAIHELADELVRVWKGAPSVAS